MKHIIHDNLSERVYSILLQQIIDGKLSFNTQLKEVDIAKSLNVSRTPVREAFRKLERDGLLVHKSRVGVFVKPLTPQAVTEICEVRVCLEALAMKLAFPNITDVVIERFSDELDKVENLSGNKQSSQFIHSDSSFHRGISKLSSNPYLEGLLENLFTITHLLRVYDVEVPFRVKDAMQEHRDIVESLRIRDLNQAVMSLEKHIYNTRDSIIKNL
jgi:DNA-binding GntR family transcriptional regulator